MKYNIYFLLIFSLTSLILWELTKESILKDKCLDYGGKWASNGNYCINPDCALYGLCRPSYNNSLICKKLALGISWKELLFNLGMPILTNGDKYFFSGGGSASPIKAVVKNGKLYALDCET